MTTEELIAYGQELLIFQYVTLPKARGHVAALIRAAISDMIIQSVRDGFNVNTAVGKQLDALADLVGAQRRIGGFNPGKSFFAFPSYSTPSPGNYGGFASYADTSPTAIYWERYSDAVNAYVLSDGQLRSFIRFMAYVNGSDFSPKSLDRLCYDFFGVYVLFLDSGASTITYQHSTSDPNVFFDMLVYLNLLPHPAGVEALVQLEVGPPPPFNPIPHPV